MRRQGRITEWRDGQGFGFVTPNGGGEKVFLHIKAFDPPARRPAGNELVDYFLAADDKGRPRAERVKYARVGAQAPSPGKATRFPRLAVALGFLAALAALVFFSKLPVFVAGIYAVMSVVTFAGYAIDKSAAQQGRWRTPESTLHLMALAGGWPGALMAQQLLRHKSVKREFLFVFWITVIINLCALAWLLGEEGAAQLAALRS